MIAQGLALADGEVFVPVMSAGLGATGAVAG